MSLYDSYAEDINIEDNNNIIGSLSEKNTWLYDSSIEYDAEYLDENNSISKDIKIINKKNYLEIHNIKNNISLKIDYFFESLFYCLVEYKYLPYKFVKKYILKNYSEDLIDQNFLQDEVLIYGDKNNKVNKVLSKLINCGLLWVDLRGTLDFFRPTLLMYSLFEGLVITKNNKKTISSIDLDKINYHQFIHDVNIVNIMLEIMNGDTNNDVVSFFSEYINRKDSNFLPGYKISQGKNSCNIISESEYRTLFSIGTSTYDVYKIEKEIKDQAMNGARKTLELENYEYFPIMVMRDGHNLDKTVSTSYYRIFPDITVPIERKSNGLPQSIAIECELSCKSVQDYVKILKQYKNNNKYGNLIYYAGKDKIIENLNKAIDIIESESDEEGLGTCNFYIVKYNLVEV